MIDWVHSRYIKLWGKSQKYSKSILCSWQYQVIHENSNCFMRDEMVDFPKFGHISRLTYTYLLTSLINVASSRDVPFHQPQLLRCLHQVATFVPLWSPILFFSLSWPDRYFLRNGAYPLEIISAYSEKGSGPKLKPYSFCHVPRCRFIVVTFLELFAHCWSSSFDFNAVDEVCRWMDLRPLRLKQLEALREFVSGKDTFYRVWKIHHFCCVATLVWHIAW